MQDPIGKKIQREPGDRPGAAVVGGAKMGKYLLPWEAPAPYVYLPYEQNQRSEMTLIAQSLGDPASLAAPLRAVVHSLDPDEPVYNVRTVASYQSAALSNWQVLLRMIATMGLIGLVTKRPPGHAHGQDGDVFGQGIGIVMMSGWLKGMYRN